MADIDSILYDKDFGDGFQRHILAVIARIPGFAVRCRDVLDPAYFVSDVHRAVAEAILGHIDEYDGTTPTRDTLLQACREEVAEEDLEVIEATIAEIFTEPVHDHAAVERRVIEFGKRQAMLNAVIEGAECIERGNIEKVEGLVRDALLVGENLLDLGINYKETSASRFDSYQNPQVEAVEKIPTGIRHLDYLLDGGMSRGELAIVLAPPKRGKSTLLVNIGFGALAALAGFNVVHYSCEISDKIIVKRYDDRLAGSKVGLRKKDPAAFSDLLRKRIGLVHGALAVKRYYTREASVDTIRSHMTLLAANGMKPDLVIVDYGQILRSTDRRKGEYRHEQASIYEDLRGLAGQHDCVVWSAVQANRAALDKDTMTIGDVSEAFEIAAVCDAMIALCQTTDESIEGICRLFAAAVRDAPSERTVECVIRRDACFIQSRALFDPAGSRLYMPGEPLVDEDEEDSREGRIRSARKIAGTDAGETPPEGKKVRRKKAPSKRIT